MEETSTIQSGAENLLALAVGGASAVAMRNTLGQQAVMGAFYALGAEPIVANASMGAVFSNQNQSVLASQARYGLTNIQAQQATGSSFLSRMLSGPVSFKGDLTGDMYTASGQNLVKGGVIKGSKASAMMPLALNVIGGVYTLADEGAAALPGYLARDFLTNYYAMKNTIVGGDIVDSKKAEKFFSLKTEALKDIKSVQTATRMLGMPLLGRISSIFVGHTGALAGATAGSSLMRGLASSLNSSGFDFLNEDIAGMFGYIFGAAGGAAVGSYLGSSLAGLAIAGAGLYATKEVVSSTYAMVEGGFARAQRNKGLNYAGDTAAFFTQNAVTMRERALQAMNKSHMNARSAFGQEANIVHMNRDMFSHYKRY